MTYPLSRRGLAAHPTFFAEVVKQALGSGAKVLPVAKALALVCGQSRVWPKDPVTSRDSRFS